MDEAGGIVWWKIRASGRMLMVAAGVGAVVVDTASAPVLVEPHTKIIPNYCHSMSSVQA